LLNRLIASGLGINDLTSENNKLLKYALGIEIDPESKINEADLQEIIENARTVQLKPELEPIKADDIKVEGLLHVTAVVDSIVNSD